VRPTVSRATLALFVAAADVTFALAYDIQIAWLLAALAPFTLFVRDPHPPPFLARVLTWVAWALTATAMVRGDDLGRPVGVALAVLGILFLTDERSFPPARTVFPAAIGILLAAAAPPQARHFLVAAWIAAAALVVWLLSGMRGALAPRRLVATAVALAVSAAIAHGLIVFLPWAQPQVEQATVSYITPNSAETGLAEGGRLGEVAELGLSHRVLLRMWSARPANLRAGVFTRFDGHEWHAPARPQALVSLLAAGEDWYALPGASASSASRPARIVLAERIRGFLPAPANVDAARGVADFARLDRFGLLVAPARLVEEYGVRYVPGPAGETDDATALAESREPPAHPDPRMVALAQQLADGAGSAEEKILRTSTYLQSKYRYSLTVGAFRTQDPVAEFLFEKKAGYCEYFASATVLLLRLQGVPARYVSGLSVRDANRRGDHYVVRASDAHAWAEALVPGRGWVEVDSTPAGDYDALRKLQHESFWEALQEDVRTWWSERSAAHLLRSLVPWLLLALVAAYVSVRWLRRRRRARAAPPPPPIGVPSGMVVNLRRLDAAWARAGFPRPPHRAPLEHARDLPADRVPPGLKAIGLDIALCFYRGAYGGAVIDDAEVARLSRGLDEVSG
jgi:hypothetical protein